MQVKTLDYYSSKTNGTSLQGYVTTTYDKLVAVFGKGLGCGDKTTQEWILEFDNGVVATIYDWKEYETPQGEYDWHVGGRRGTNVVALVQQALDGIVEVVDAFDEESEYYGA